MQRIFYSLIAVLFTTQLLAAVWNVEVGGGGEVDPYYSPQFISIEVGDVVTWTWVSGEHNVSATSGPESFNSGTYEAPHDFSFTFTLPGFYEYECSLYDHADTQFGTITVAPLSVFTQIDNAALGFMVYPNPVSDLLSILPFAAKDGDWQIADLSGRTMMRFVPGSSHIYTIDVSSFPSGIYFVECISTAGLQRRRVVIQQAD